MERLVFAWTFWQLGEGNLIELAYLEVVDDDEAAEASARDEPPSEIVVRRVCEPRGVGGLDAEVLTACRPVDEPIGPVLRRWAGEHIPLPLYAVVRGLQMEAATYGLGELEAGGRSVNRFSDHHLASFVADCEQIAALEPRFAELAGGWREFERQLPRASAGLEEACRLALFDLRPPPITAIGGPTPN